VATLHDYDENYGLFLIVYHNFFAKNPLPKALFAHAKDKQLEKPGDPETSPRAVAAGSDCRGREEIKTMAKDQANGPVSK
jgi:hypothetical protein